MKTNTKRDIKSIIKNPHITEKAFSGTEREGKRSYVFVVDKKATKPLVAEAVKTLYSVKVVRVNITNIPSQAVRHRGRLGLRSGYKKATVFLAPGQKIDIA